MSRRPWTECVPSAEISSVWAPGMAAVNTHRRSMWRSSAQSTPDELIKIHYDSRDNLIAMGAIPAPRYRPQRAPEPFPGPVGFVPDPPRRW